MYKIKRKPADSLTIQRKIIYTDNFLVVIIFFVFRYNFDKKLIKNNIENGFIIYIEFDCSIYKKKKNFWCLQQCAKLTKNNDFCTNAASKYNSTNAYATTWRHLLNKHRYRFFFYFNYIAWTFQRQMEINISCIHNNPLNRNKSHLSRVKILKDGVTAVRSFRFLIGMRVDLNVFFFYFGRLLTVSIVVCIYQRLFVIVKL